MGIKAEVRIILKDCKGGSETKGDGRGAGGADAIVMEETGNTLVGFKLRDVQQGMARGKGSNA